MKGPLYDFVIAGSGAGGGCAAARLVAGGARVLLLESGGFAEPEPDAMEAVGRYYRDAGFSSAFGNTVMPVPTGRAVGGTTVINSGTCLRPPRDALLRWAEASGGRFDPGEFSGFVEDAWEALSVKRAPERTLSRSSRLALKGFRLAGIPGAAPLDRAERGCSGSGRCCFVCPADAKSTSRNVFLDPLRGAAGLELRPDTELTGLRLPRRGGGAIEVGFRSRGASGKARCRALILAAGALRTPYFVRAFRLGERWRSAGDGLSLHPAAKLFGVFPERVEGWKGVPQGVGAEDPEHPEVRFEGVYTPPELAALTMPLDGRRLRWWMERYDRVATFGYMIRDASRGRVRFPLGPDRPWIRYDLVPSDMRLMTRGMRVVAGVLLAAGAERVVLPLNREENEAASSSELELLDREPPRPRELQTMAFHPLGTCAMGRTVDYDLELCPGVYACDGSVVPESLGVNPQITIYAFALRLASFLLKKA